MSKRNKSLIALLLVLCVGLVGLTIAYFSNSTEIENEFKTKEYGTTYTEDFVSPSNWLPGDTTDKIVTVTNSGQVDEAVRISLSETWTPNDSNATLTGWIHADGTKSNHTTEEELATDVRAAVINFTENSDWTKVGDYYYYNYRLQPGETTDSLIESVTFNALTKLGDTCITSSENGIKTITCNSSGEDYDNATYKLTLTIETTQYNKYQEAWSTDVAIATEKPITVQQFLLKSNPIIENNTICDKIYLSGDVHQMYTFNHDATEQTPALTDYRYIGNDPYNYVYFNCDSLDNQDSDTCEVWRIIGVFDVERPDQNDNKKTITERRIKLVRGSVFDDKMDWDVNHSNNWSIASLNSFLNNDYYMSLSISSRLQLDDAIFYLGSFEYNRLNSTEQIYEYERGTVNHKDAGPISWSGKIGLMYASDMYMTYANGVDCNCYNYPAQCTYSYPWGESPNNPGNPSSGWIHNSNIYTGQDNENSATNYPYFITHRIKNDNDLSIYYPGANGALASLYGAGAVRPVLYLKSSVKIYGGDGSLDNPYKLK